jgi:hypothetical protein
VELLARDVNGWPRGRADAATTMLLKALDEDGGWNVRYAMQIARAVHGEFPDSRVAALADLAEARAMMSCRRPEALIPVAEAVIAATSAGDPLHEEADSLLAKARADVAAKGQGQ